MANKKLNDLTRSKIEEVASLDGSVEEMAYYADVTRQTVWNWLSPKSDYFDEKLAKRVEKLRSKPILKARQTVVNSLNDPANAFKYLEKKKRKEFGPNLDITSGGDKLPTPILDGIRTDNSDKEDSEADKED